MTRLDVTARQRAYRALADAHPAEFAVLLEAQCKALGVVRRGRATAEKCVHGHPWTPATTYIDPAGHRTCRLCRRAQYKTSRSPQSSSTAGMPGREATHLPDQGLGEDAAGTAGSARRPSRG